MIQLSHIGEGLLARMLSDSVSVRNTLFGHLPSSKPTIFVPELRLNNCGGLAFDGVHKIDVAALCLATGICYPIEAKLGFDRLGKNEFEKRFLIECETSHKNTRVKGSMISILERKLPQACRGHNLTVTWQDREFTVSPFWILIARAAVTSKWNESQAPELSSNCKVSDFERLLEAYGSGSEFNSLVRNLIDFDYFNEWRCGA